MRDVVFAAAIPVFFAMILAEFLVGRARGQRLYRLNDAVACLSCGVGNLLAKLLYGAALVAVYVGVHTWLAPWHLDADRVSTWVIGFLGVDFMYYWWHRATHRTKALWTTHVVHHQSEDYNLAVALRQSWTSPLSSLPFDLVLALAGIPPIVTFTSAAINTLYQFWIHTELVDRLGPLEWVMNTPSHHRVHHAVDPRYLDKNYAGVFILWDRLFGTFVAEDTHPTYGTVAPLRSFNPAWANWVPFRDLWRELAAEPSWSARWRLLWQGPEWGPDGPKEIPEPEAGRLTWDVAASTAVQRYVALQFVACAVAVTFAVYDGPTWSWMGRAVAALVLVWTLVAMSGLMESRGWARGTELGRLVVVAVVALGVAALPAWSWAWGWVGLAYVGTSGLGLASALVPASGLEPAR